MAKPNYQYEKRQREMAKKAKQEEKRRQKLKDVPKDDSSPLPQSESDVAPIEGGQQ